MQVYPLKLKPAVKEIIWGGDKLKTAYGKEAPFEKLAESWELTVRPDGMNVIENGEYAGMTLGEYIENAGNSVIAAGYDADRFPLLIKFIDARDRLSIQVHPSDDYALANENEYGKTEVWYIVEADEGAELVFGLSRDYTKEAFDKAVAENTVETLLNRVKVQKGDVYFIPSGLVHAIGAGILICEIQQNSNTTYRVYDYNRRDKDGNLRPLHVAKALEVSCLQKSPDLPATPDGADVLLAACEYFEVRRLRVNGETTVTADESSFVSLMVTDGEGTLTYADGELSFTKGDSLFIPAQNAAFTITGQCELIQSKVN